MVDVINISVTDQSIGLQRRGLRELVVELNPSGTSRGPNGDASATQRQVKYIRLVKLSKNFRVELSIGHRLGREPNTVRKPLYTIGVTAVHPHIDQSDSV